MEFRYDLKTLNVKLDVDKRKAIETLNAICEVNLIRERYFRSRKEVLNFVRDYFLYYEKEVRKKLGLDFKLFGIGVLVLKDKKIVGWVRFDWVGFGFCLNKKSFEKMDKIFEKLMEVIE